jgi:hypothetical protein
MADDARDFGVDELLGDDGPLLRISLIGLRLELEFHGLSADGHALGIELVDRQLRAVLVVLALVGLRSGQRRREADLHDLLRLRTARAHGERDTQHKRGSTEIAAAVHGLLR